MVDKEFCKLIVNVENFSVTFLKSLVEARTENTHNGDDSHNGSDSTFNRSFKGVPAKHHECDCSHKEDECDYWVNVQLESVGVAAFHGFSCFAVSFAHAFFE